jgi:hypothetical protein
VRLRRKSNLIFAAMSVAAFGRRKKTPGGSMASRVLAERARGRVLHRFKMVMPLRREAKLGVTKMLQKQGDMSS